MIPSKKKRGQVLLYGAIAGLIAAIIVSVFSSASNKGFEVIGVSSLALIKVSKEAEKVLI